MPSAEQDATGSPSGRAQRPRSASPTPRLCDSTRKSRSRSEIASILIESLLSDDERPTECADEDLESTQPRCLRQGTGQQLARGIDGFRNCVKRVQLGIRWMKNFSPEQATQLKQLRLLDRFAPFGQSKGVWSVRNIAVNKAKGEGDERPDAKAELRTLFLGDFYHMLLDARLSKQIAVFAAAYVLCFLAFAVLYLMVSEPCNLQLQNNFIRAYLFSVETMMTVGYGCPDPYMNGCWQGAVILTTQVLLQLLFTGCLIGVIFQGLSRPQSRSRTVLFSEKAVIRYIDGAHYLMFRITDLRVQHPLIEPHVRCYCVVKDPVRGFEMVPMRLDHPDDELGGMLVLTIPYLVVHRIDAWSPLAPALRADSLDIRRTLSPGRVYPSDSPTTDSASTPRWHRHHEYLRSAGWPGPGQRQVDCETGNRDSCVCPTCGEAFGTASMLTLHCRYNARSDVASGIAPEDCHQELTEEEVAHLSHKNPSREQLLRHHRSNFLEVVVLVEGIEPTTSGTLQSRYSYVVGPSGADVAWDMEFAECCRLPLKASKGLVVDVSLFHSLVGP
mmetsp:Transcript_20189/g.55930  ORF Transcript_20189/g.55930 Transcript_20189/m.55930 type:complete len:557 (-) Transcript_20189:182-1852(-)